MDIKSEFADGRYAICNILAREDFIPSAAVKKV
jgi:hypothetical protein